MLNTEHSYYEAGYKVARARNRRDEGLAQFMKRWFIQAQALERDDEDRAEARRLFEKGYAEARRLS